MPQRAKRHYVSPTGRATGTSCIGNGSEILSQIKILPEKVVVGKGRQEEWCMTFTQPSTNLMYTLCRPRNFWLTGTHIIFLQDPGMNASYWFQELQELSSCACCVQATEAALKKTMRIFFPCYVTDSSLIPMKGAFMRPAQLPQPMYQLEAILHYSLTVLQDR